MLLTFLTREALYRIKTRVLKINENRMPAFEYTCCSSFALLLPAKFCVWYPNLQWLPLNKIRVPLKQRNPRCFWVNMPHSIRHSKGMCLRLYGNASRWRVLSHYNSNYERSSRNNGYHWTGCTVAVQTCRPQMACLCNASDTSSVRDKI